MTNEEKDTLILETCMIAGQCMQKSEAYLRAAANIGPQETQTICAQIAIRYNELAWLFADLAEKLQDTDLALPPEPQGDLN